MIKHFRTALSALLTLLGVAAIAAMATMLPANSAHAASGEIRIGWATVPGCHHNINWRKTGSDDAWQTHTTPVDTSFFSLASYTITGLAPGTNYDVWHKYVTRPGTWERTRSDWTGINCIGGEEYGTPTIYVQRSSGPVAPPIVEDTSDEVDEAPIETASSSREVDAVGTADSALPKTVRVVSSSFNGSSTHGGTAEDAQPIKLFLEFDRKVLLKRRHIRVDGGTLMKVYAITSVDAPGAKFTLEWKLRVQPTTDGDMTISIPARRRIQFQRNGETETKRLAGFEKIVSGPAPLIQVANARRKEKKGAINFTVSLRA